MDVLNSLELVLMNNLTLAAFEKFLTQDSVPLYSDSFTYEFFLQGLPLLDFYKKCVVFLNSPGQSSFSIVHNEYIENKNVIPSEIIEILEEGFEIENVERAKVSAFRILEQHFYPKFQMSEEYRELKRQIHKKEIFNFRVMQTSFHGIFYLVSLAKKKRVNSSTPRKRVESLL